MLSCFAVCFSAVPFALEVFNDVVLAPVRNLKLTYSDITFWRWRSLRPSWAQLNLALVTWQDIALHWCRLWINGRIQPKETTLKWILCRPCKQPVDVVLKTQMMAAWNGEDIYHCDSVVDEALDIYLSKCKREGDREGHFIRQSFVDSKAKCLAKLPVMCNDKWSKTCEKSAKYASCLWNRKKALKVAEMVYLCTKLVNLTWFTHFCRWSHLSQFTRFWGDQPWP